MEKEASREYYFDKIRINSKQNMKDVYDVLPIEDLKEYCRSFLIMPPYSVAKRWGVNRHAKLIQ
jgi:hypothetical protein